ncbi:MAG: sigma-54-dependent Fis family transcriptional regulator [Myxococcales bacterium]|nr:sigma-54-dependent Fis family transcriptional regulator [Myxococcales bacterium]
MKILVVDDDRYTQRLIEVMCRDAGWSLQFASNGQEALDILAHGEAVDLVLSDVMMPLMGGEALLEELRLRAPDIPVIVMTSHGSIDNAVSFLKAGAIDYIPKPLHKEVLLHRLRTVLGRHQLAEENSQLRKELGQRKELGHIVRSSPRLMDILKKLPSIAKTDASVVIYGESGTGKELIAQAIHALSSRHRASLVTVNCGALPEALLESELFGYKKGAFTDAVRDHDGLVKEADRGTLFLDEIGEISLNVQVKLLRFLQQKEYKPLGSVQTQRADVRFISATNRDLLSETRSGRFREDLYYRLNIIPIWLPSLRERREDIPLLVRHFLRRAAKEVGRPLLHIEPQAMLRLQNYDWPGNIRELENKIVQLAVMTEEDVIRGESIIWPETRATHSILGASPSGTHYPSPIPNSIPSYYANPIAPVNHAQHAFSPQNYLVSSGAMEPWESPKSAVDLVDVSLEEDGSFGELGYDQGDSLLSSLIGGDELLPFREAKAKLLEHFERAYIERLLRLCGGNVSQAARESGMDRKNFWEKMKRYGVDAQEFA